MRCIVLILTLGLALPAAAQEAERDLEEGLDLFSEGARRLLQGLMDELEPTLDDLREALDGLDAYEAPEVLPNGDIIIRRKQPLNRETVPPEGEEIEI